MPATRPMAPIPEPRWAAPAVATAGGGSTERVGTLVGVGALPLLRPVEPCRTVVGGYVMTVVDVVAGLLGYGVVSQTEVTGDGVWWLIVQGQSVIAS